MIQEAKSSGDTTFTRPVLHRHLKKTALKAGITKEVSAHALHHGFTTHLIENGSDFRTVQDFLGHSSLKTTMIYTHLAAKNKLGVKSPFDLSGTQK